MPFRFIGDCHGRFLLPGECGFKFNCMKAACVKAVIAVNAPAVIQETPGAVDAFGLAGLLAEAAACAFIP